MSWLFKVQKSPEEKIRKDIKKLSRHVLTIPHEGKDYKFYELATIHDMPSKRYKIMNQFIEDARLNIQKEELAFYLKQIEDNMNANTAEGNTNAAIITKWLKARTNISMDVDLVMRVISCCLLLEDENPLDYDWDINDFKIELFEKSGVTAFFLSEPIKKYLKQIGLSNLDMEATLKQRKLSKTALKELEQMGISVWLMSTKTLQEQNST